MGELKRLKTQDLLNYFYKPDVGSATFALTHVARLVAAQVPVPPDWARDRIPVAQRKLRDALAMRYDWDNRRKKDKLRREGAPELDSRVDRAVSALFKTVEAYLEFDPASRTYQLAKELLDELFPDGVKPITSVRYELEHSKVDELLGRLHGPLAGHVDELHLRLFVDRLDDVNQKYGHKITALDNKSIDFSDVEDAEDIAIEAYFEVILVLWTAFLDEPDVRARLLAPVEEQNQRIAEYFKTRNTRPKVDPDTGEIIEPEDATDAPDDAETNDDAPADPTADPAVDPAADPAVDPVADTEDEPAVSDA